MAQVGIINPFTDIMGIHSPSTVFAGFRGYIVEGLNDGIENNQNSSKSVIGTWVDSIKGWFTDLLDIHSPSKLFSEYGSFTVEGFNAGITDNMDSATSLVEQWADDVSNAFQVANVLTPEIGTSYSVSTEFFDKVDTSQYDFKSGISTELNAALSGIFDYDQLGSVLAEKLESVNITVELDSDKAYSNVKDKWKMEYSRNKTAPVPI
ncbi:MAG: phage tail tape measure protein [Firmicutes bacterium]|nr:phage tail tape measure protein [Bacillota bacterium]